MRSAATHGSDGQSSRDARMGTCLNASRCVRCTCRPADVHERCDPEMHTRSVASVDTAAARPDARNMNVSCLLFRRTATRASQRVRRRCGTPVFSAATVPKHVVASWLQSPPLRIARHREIFSITGVRRARPVQARLGDLYYAPPKGRQGASPPRARTRSSRGNSCKTPPQRGRACY